MYNTMEKVTQRNKYLLTDPVIFTRWENTALNTRTLTLFEHEERFGKVSCTPDLLNLIESANLTGYGGGHFSVGSKWRSVLASSKSSVVIANGAEGEPVSVKDAALMQTHPHLILDGLWLAMQTLNAKRGVIYLAKNKAASNYAIKVALEQRQDLKGLVSIVTCSERYISGESSAVVNALNTNVATPYYQKPKVHVSHKGVDGLPTLVQNVETLAMVALLARGKTINECLVTVLANKMRVVLSSSDSIGLTVAKAALATGRGGLEQAQAALLGGYGGTWVPWDTVFDQNVTSLANAKPGLGAGVVVPLPVHACGLKETARVLFYLSQNTALQCGPCMFGLPFLAVLFDKLARGTLSRQEWGKLNQTLTQLPDRGACHMPNGAVNLAKSALDVFADEVALHKRTKGCPNKGHEDILPISEVNYG